MNKIFPIKNDAACQYKWAWSSIYLNTGTTASCHRCYHYKFDVDTIKDFHNLPGKLQDRTKMLQGQWPGNGCEYCRDIEVAGGLSDRTAFTNKDTTILPPELEVDPTAVKVSPTILEVYFSNLCNQSCVYCRPTFSSQIESEVRKYGPSKYNSNYSEFLSDDRKNYATYRDKFFEWMAENGNKLVMFKMLGGEPFYQEEFEMCLDFFDNNPCPDLKWHIFTNLNHEPQKFASKLSKVNKLILEKKIKGMEVVCSIDCWGPDLEYVRYGLNGAWAEQNILTLLHAEGVEVQLHATITALSMPSMYLLAQKVGEWQQIKQKLFFHWNTVHTPECFDIYHFGDRFVKDVDRLIEALKANSMHDFQNTIYGIRTKMLSSKIDKKQVADLYNFLNDLDVRRKDDWKNRLPHIASIMQDIIDSNT
jgi:hypothetical protein